MPGEQKTSGSCTACGGALKPYLSRVNDYISGEFFAIVRCERCGLGVTEPSPQDLSRYYRAYYGGRHGSTGNFRAKRRFEMIRKKSVGKKSSVLDVGCGEGTFLLCAREAGWSVAGSEMNPEPARAQGLETVSDLKELGTRQFDFVTLWHSLEHMRDPVETLRAVRPLLTDGGWLLVAVPNAGGWQANATGAEWLHLDVPRHLFHFTRNSLRALHETCGYAVREEHHQEFEYDVLGWSQSVLNKLLPTRNLFFRQLTGKAEGTPGWERAVNWIAGPAVTAPAIPLTLLGAACQEGGTLVFASQKA